MNSGKRPIKVEPDAEDEYQHVIPTPIEFVADMIKDEEQAQNVSSEWIHNSSSSSSTSIVMTQPLPSTSSNAIASTSMESHNVSPSNSRDPQYSSEDEYEVLDDAEVSDGESADGDEPCFDDIPIYDLNAFSSHEVSILHKQYKRSNNNSIYFYLFLS